MIHNHHQQQQELKDKLMSAGAAVAAPANPAARGGGAMKAASAFNVIKSQESSSPSSSSSSSCSSSSSNQQQQHSMASNILQNLLEMNSKNFMLSPGFAHQGSHAAPPLPPAMFPGILSKPPLPENPEEEKSHFSSFNDFYQAAMSNLGQPAFRGAKAAEAGHGGVVPGAGLKIPSYFESPLANVQIQYDCAAPIARNTPENNECRLINYRQTKIASFRVDGKELICLPQAFEMFLKTLVGGLHTVYTKLKRLDITPIVCNVEQVEHSPRVLLTFTFTFSPASLSFQVRVLRGLGAIQPGVNRCKLIAPGEFDVLYEDCTNSG